jgi:putative transposase
MAAPRKYPDELRERAVRLVLGWKADTTMRAALVTDTLEMAVWSRGRAGVADLSG